jgi:hypothetical protein
MKEEILNYLKNGATTPVTNYSIALAIGRPEPSVRRATRELYQEMKIDRDYTAPYYFRYVAKDF